MRALAAALCLAAPIGARASETAPAVEGRAVETEETELVRRTAARLQSDPALRERLARRILASSLAGHFTGSEDPGEAQAEVGRWIEEHPADAAQLAAGFAKDDRDGTRSFEESLFTRVERYFALNPERHKGILGTLSAAGSQSRSIIAQAKLPEEEQQELVKRIFEGGRAPAGRAPEGTPGQSGGPPAPAPRTAAPPAFAGAGLYDRVSALNPTGYSPQVLAFQSALNAQSVPGAPRLVETGRLDFPTLVHPFYSMRYDLERLEAERRSQKAWALARLLKREREYADRLRDPAALKELESAAAGRAIDPGFKRREAAIARAAQALLRFRREAEKTRDPKAIAPATLKSLGLKQKEAARWIAAAYLDAELQRLEADAGFWTGDLRRQIESAPAPEAARRGYLDLGSRLKERLELARGSARKALAALESEAWLSRWPEIERALAAAPGLRKDLSRDIAAYAALPARLQAAVLAPGFWRSLANRWVRRLAPNSDYARRLEREEKNAALLQEAFGRVASGDFPGAHKLLAELATVPLSRR